MGNEAQGHTPSGGAHSREEGMRTGAHLQKQDLLLLKLPQLCAV